MIRTGTDTGPRGSSTRAGARRPALDGLRAIAVLAVVVYHFGGGATSWLPGGFLGVDMFFVLSGYLITGQLLAEVRRSGRVDLLGFWGKRVRRLLPPAALLLIGVALWTWWAGAPETWTARRGDLLWTISYLANWHLLAAGEDYFATYTGASPMRHMWSLAVEEQFYVVWPLVVALGVVALRRLRRSSRQPGATVVPVAVLGVGVVAGLSAVAMALHYIAGDTNRAYYGTDTRAHELLWGALGALFLARRAGTDPARAQTGRRPSGPVLGWLLAGCLLTAFVIMDDSSAPYYLGGSVLVCAVAAALVLEVERRPGGPLARALSWRPAVALGRVSYGVYLWHWPLVLWIPWDSASPVPDQVLAQTGRAALTLALALLSFVLVERPVLAGKVRWVGLRPGRTLLAGAVVVVLCLCVSVRATALPGSIATQLAQSSDTSCPGETITSLTTCVRGSDDVDPDVMVLGDSTARAYGPGLDVATSAQGRSWVQAAWQRCVPTGLLVVPSDASEPGPEETACARSVRSTITAALAEYEPSVVVVAEFWSHHQPLIVDGKTLLPGSAEHTQAEHDAYVDLVREITATGARVVLLELPPPGDSLGSAIAAGRPAGAAGRMPGSRYVEGFDAVLEQVAEEEPGVVALSLEDLFCPDGVCSALTGDTVIRVDGVHLSRRYSRQIGPEVLRRVDDAAAEASAELDPS